MYHQVRDIPVAPAVLAMSENALMGHPTNDIDKLNCNTNTVVTAGKLVGQRTQSYYF